MRGHTVPRFHELTATAGGKNPTATPGTSVQSVIFDVKGVPTGDKGKFWYYALGAVIKAVFTLNQPSSGSAVINADQLWQLMASFQWTSPILGELFSHRNTRGAVLGNVIMPFARGLKAPPARAQIATTSGNTTVTLTYKLPLAYSFLEKPHETAPWAGFLEGGQIECKIDTASTIATVSPGASILAANFRCHLQLIPSPEPVIHVPVNWREFVLPGSTTRHLFTDFGQPDGLQGIDTKQGVGVGALLYLCNPTGLGLNGAGHAGNITSYDVPFRTQARIDDSAAPMQWWLEAMEKRPGQVSGSGTTIVADDGGWPYAIGGTPNGDVLDRAGNSAILYPFVAPVTHTETSKVQTARGPQEINVGYGSDNTPSGSARFALMQFMRFSPDFEQGLQDLILGYHDPMALRAPKTLKKNDMSTVHVHNPKLAYTRRKIYLPQR